MPRESLKGKVVIWPVNIDCRYSRSQGRKLSEADCVEAPSLQEIARAASDLGLEPYVDDASYPRLWYEVKGRVIVNRAGGKVATLKKVAETIRLRRQGRR